MVPRRRGSKTDRRKALIHRSVNLSYKRDSKATKLKKGEVG